MSEFGSWYKQSEVHYKGRPAERTLMNAGDPFRPIYKEVDVCEQKAYTRRLYVHFPSGWKIEVKDVETEGKTWYIINSDGDNVTPATTPLIQECLKRLNFGLE